VTVTILTTPRLALLPLSQEAMAVRMESDDFTLACAFPDGPRRVHFGPEWPGEVLHAFPMLLRVLTDRDCLEHSYVAVDAASGEAIGQLGAKGEADEAGRVEIGYGLNESVWGLGFGTEAVGALCGSLWETPGIRSIAAETAVGNVASQRVLEKNGFVRVGVGWTPNDGDVILWSTTVRR
jgi:RimJ/RimL family protein N-acetyltransferase